MSKLDFPDPFEAQAPAAPAPGKLDFPDPFAAAPVASLADQFREPGGPPVAAPETPDVFSEGAAQAAAPAERFLPEVQRAGLGAASEIALGLGGLLHKPLEVADMIAGLDPRTPPGLNVSDLPFRAADLAGNTAAAIPEPSKPAQFLQMPAAGLAGMFGSDQPRQVIQQGGTVEQGQAAAGLGAAENMASMLVPYLGKGLVSRLMMQSAAAPLTAEAGRRAGNELLPESMQREYSPWESIMSILGAAPFALMPGHAGESVTPRDAARAAEGVERAEVAATQPPPPPVPTAPGMAETPIVDPTAIQVPPPEPVPLAAAVPPGVEPAPPVEPPVTPVEARAPEPVQPAVAEPPAQLPLPLEVPRAEEAHPAAPAASPAPVATGREPVPGPAGVPAAEAEAGGAAVATEPVAAPAPAAAEPVAEVGAEPAPPPLITPDEAGTPTGKPLEQITATEPTEAPEPPAPGQPIPTDRAPGQVGITKADAAASRESVDLPPLPNPHKLSNEEAVARAKLEIAHDPDIARKTTDEIIANPTAVDPVKKAILAHDRQRIEQDLVRTGDAVRAAPDPESKAAAQAMRDLAEIDLDLNTKATTATGTESGRSLQAHQITVLPDYSLGTILSKAKDAHKGKIPEPLRQELEGKAARIKELEDQLAKRRKAKGEEEGKSPPKTVDEKKQAEVNKKIAKLKDQIAARRKACPI